METRQSRLNLESCGCWGRRRCAFRLVCFAATCELLPLSYAGREPGAFMAQQSLPPFSETVKLAWRLAAEEAVHAGRPQIEPPHLLLGIFGVDRVIREEAWERYAVSGSRLGMVRQEWNEVSSAAAMAGLDAIHLRREVRARLPQNSIALPANHVAKRSDSTRAIFDQAEQRAATVGHALVSLFDVLACLLPAMAEKDQVIPAHF